jgi:hypothetical protein
VPSTEQTVTPLLVVSLVFTTRLPAPPMPVRSTFARSAQLRGQTPHASTEIRKGHRGVRPSLKDSQLSIFSCASARPFVQ